MRYFRLEEALRALPQVEELLRDALFHKAEAERIHAEIERTLERVRQSGGGRLDPARQREQRLARDSHVHKLQSSMEAVAEHGALVKDLDIGLLDFMARYQGRDVCLCWKLGESTITHWHGVEEGFGGRKEIDADFVANHSGEAGASGTAN
jgi:hypothetical protein